MYIIKGNSKIYIYDFDDDGSTPKQSLNIAQNPNKSDKSYESESKESYEHDNSKVVRENFKAPADTIDWVLVIMFGVAIILILALMAWFIFKNREEEEPLGSSSSIIAVSSLENIPNIPNTPNATNNSQLVRPISTMSISPSYAITSPQTATTPTDYARVPELKKFVIPVPEGKSHGQHHKHKKASPKKKRCLV